MGRREEERNHAGKKRDDEKDKETSEWRIVELQTAIRYRLVHYLASHLTIWLQDGDVLS